jgi:hypothetical protein
VRFCLIEFFLAYLDFVFMFAVLDSRLRRNLQFLIFPSQAKATKAKDAKAKKAN